MLSCLATSSTPTEAVIQNDPSAAELSASASFARFSAAFLNGFLRCSFCDFLRRLRTHGRWPRVPRLIDAKRSAARQRHPREQTPTLILDRGAADIALLHLSDKCLDVVAHQIELVCIVFVGRMHGNFCRR